jgi:hypothetical protein
VKLFRKHRNLLLGLAFAAATVVAWRSTFKAYTRGLGMIQTDGKSYHFNLDHVAQRLGEYPGLTLEQWLGPQGADVVRLRRTEYRGKCAAALLCGFMTVFCVGMYLDGLKTRSGESEQGPIDRNAEG